MPRPRFTLIAIIILVAVAALVSIPRGVPISFSLGPVSVDRVTKSPRIYIPGLGVDREIKTHLGLDLQGGTQVVLDANMSEIAPGERETALEGVREVIERRVNFFGVTEPVVQTAKVGDQYRLIVELPGVTDANTAVATIGQTARLEFREFSQEATQSAFLFPTIENTQPVGITGKDLKKAEVAFDPTTGEPGVSFELTQDGGEKFEEVTTRLVGKPLAIFMDDVAISWPTVEVPITAGAGVITGNFTRDEARSLALQLSAGALPVPVKVVEQKNVGPSLGAQAISKSVRAGVIGLTLVGVFMVSYYGRLGLIANGALIVYGLLTYALFRLIPVTLTVPGVAGFILSVGMAVDSNILIFERFKEELRAGKPGQVAMELGFGRAWDSIRDANFTTIITALILINPLNWEIFPVSGAVRGFAITLFIGVIMSLFTGIIVTRNLIRLFYRYKYYD